MKHGIIMEFDHGSNFCPKRAAVSPPTAFFQAKMIPSFVVSISRLNHYPHRQKILSHLILYINIIFTNKPHYACILDTIYNTTTQQKKINKQQNNLHQQLPDLDQQSNQSNNRDRFALDSTLCYGSPGVTSEEHIVQTTTPSPPTTNPPHIINHSEKAQIALCQPHPGQSTRG